MRKLGFVRSALNRSVRMSLVVSLAAAALGSGCASSGHMSRVATLTRYRAAHGQAKMPLCNAVPGDDLAAQHRAQLCLAVAKKKKMSVAASEDQRCLEPSMTWNTEVTGTQAECSLTFGYGSSCQSQARYRHSLKLVLVDSESNEPIVESRTWTRSDKPDLNDLAVYTLCAAAFFHYPESVQNVPVAVNLDK
jgi:hypothetical protein